MESLIFRLFLIIFHLNNAAHAAGKEGTNDDPVEEVAQEDDSRCNPGEEDEGADGTCKQEDGGNCATLLKIDMLEAGVDNAAHHQQ